MISFPAHPRESGEPVLSSLATVSQVHLSRAGIAFPSPKALGPRFRGDERILWVVP